MDTAGNLIPSSQTLTSEDTCLYVVV